jgi:16S rRNA (cytosine1402-N4)-methyltransferase
VLDIGVSSMQIDEAERGFSFRFDGPLDMRMERKGPSAADLVNTLEEAEIADILWRYGEERRSRAIARAIVKARAVEPITTTGALAKLVASVVWVSGDAINPATRTFQALRIAVNDELGELERGLEAAEAVLAPGGRLAVVTFHSLEDRIVKDFMTERSGRTAAPSRHLPQTQQERARFSLVTRKPITAGDAEIRLNPRARSAKLRVVERVADHAIPELAGGY